MEKLAGQKILSALTQRFEDLEKGLNGMSKSAFHKTRKKAFEQLSKQGFPHSKHEEYKFTNLTKALEKNFSFEATAPSEEVSKEAIEALRIEGLDALYLTFVNGEFQADLSDEMKTKGLSIKLLNDHLTDAEVHFGAHADDEEDAFIALNTAFSQKGWLIAVEEKAIIEKPIFLHFIQDARQAPYHEQLRNIITVGKHSELTIIEKVDTLGKENCFSGIVNEIAVAENAKTEYFKIENDVPQSYHISNTHVSQQAHSTFKSNTVTLNGAMVRNNLTIKLQGEGCASYMNGLYLTKGKTHVDNHTTVDHQVPHCYSNELYKGIMDDQSKAVFNGKIFVRQDAQKTNAFQSNKNLLMTDSATVNTKPQLEIWADDVQCSHGCTTGQLDPDALFYLRARGIHKDRALAMLLQAFASDVIDQMDNEAIQGYISDIITKRLD